MDYYDKDISQLGEQEKWIRLLCGFYAEKKLEEKYDTKNAASSIRVASFCIDGRRIPTVRKFLESKGLVVSSYKTDPTLEPIDEEVEKLIPGFTKEPEFQTDGYRKEDNSYGDDNIKPVKDLGDLYLPVNRFSAVELCYIYLNQSQYDFREFKTTNIYRDKRSWSDRTYVSYTLKIFPANAIESTDEVALLANNEDFAKKNAQTALTAAFNLNFKALDNKKPYFTIEDLDARILKVEDKLRLLRRTLAELSVLKRKASQLGDSYKDTILQANLDLIRRRAPMWLNSDNDDEKTIGKLFLKGTCLSTEKTIRH